MTTNNHILDRAVTDVLPKKETLQELLNSEKKLNVYLGIDPTATRIHLGHAVALRKLQEFVDAGHNVTFLIGDFTALIGDTSDKDTERPVLTQDEIDENFKTYKEQASKVLNFEKVQVKHNSEWLAKLTFTEIVKLCQEFSVGDFVGRELIKKRLQEGKKVGLHETLYPVMQGYDSYHMDTDVQIGGADQTFNMLAGRSLLKSLSGKESYVVITGYLEGTDGRKMSKSWGNAIWLTDTPNEMYGKVMSLRDELILNYFTLATRLPEVMINEIKTRLESGENPKNLKKELAHTIVTELHSSDAADLAQEYFENTFEKQSPEEYVETTVPSDATIISTVAHVVGTTSEAKRLIAAGAVDVNEQRVTDGKQVVNSGDKLKIGKKTFIEVKIEA